jgi:O-antigen/teichoic acid export membrane protein
MTLFRTNSRIVAEVVVSGGLSAALTMGYIIYVGRVLGPVEYADFAAALSVIYFVGVAMSPFTPAVARLCARYTARNDFLAVGVLRRRFIRGITIVGIAVTGAGIALSTPLADLLNFRSSLPLSVAFCVVLLYAVVSVDRGVIHGLLLFRVHNVNIVAEALVRCVCAGALLVVWRSAGAAMVSYLSALLLAELLLGIRLRKEWASDGAISVDWMEVRRVTLPILLLMIGVAAFQNSDMIVVKRFFPAVDSGAYGAATAMARAIGILFVPLYVIVSPILSGLHESGQPVFAATMRLTAIFLALAILPLVLFAGWSSRIVALLYGAGFTAAGPLLLPLAGVAVIMYTGLMLSQALVTVSDHVFLIAYSSLAIVQIVALLAFHESFHDVLRALYVVQSTVLVIVAGFFFRAWAASRQTAA